MLIQNVELHGQIEQTTSDYMAGVDVRIHNGKLVEIGFGLAPGDDPVVAGHGGALLPGLVDHHIHLFSLAAFAESVVCGPPQVNNLNDLRQVLHGVTGSGWIRGVGYHESVAGELTARDLDALVPERPFRLQHRSGKMWMLNSRAVQMLDIESQVGWQGIETDNHGVTGRLFRLDGWLSAQLKRSTPLNLARVSAELAAAGVTGLTDASVTNDHNTVDLFCRLLTEGQLRQHIRLMGNESLTDQHFANTLLTLGELKILLDEDNLPPLDELIDRIKRAHAASRGVAFHCVSRIELLFALAAIDAAGSCGSDRIEHGAVIPAEVLSTLRNLDLTVVTQPSLVALRGDQYVEDLLPHELPDLYRVRSLVNQRVALSSDAPYGSADPWLTMRCAVHRTTPSGIVVGEAECLTPEQAFSRSTTPLDDPGGPAVDLNLGSIADLCLMKLPWKDIRERLNVDDVAATFVEGERVYQS
ncbi:MAG: amidohydrolase family protein [Proteobacteria bacterium]|nr:amidohydrolase family protein [Pseudomonadota bacterium]